MKGLPFPALAKRSRKWQGHDKNDKTKSHSRFLRDRTRLKSLFRAGIKDTKRAFLSTIAAILLFLDCEAGIGPNLPSRAQRLRAKCGSGALRTISQELQRNCLELDAGSPARCRQRQDRMAGRAQPADLGKDGKHLYGWLVEFRVNSRNRFGQYTGKQSHGVLIRDDRVIKGTGFGYGE